MLGQGRTFRAKAASISGLEGSRWRLWRMRSARGFECHFGTCEGQGARMSKLLSKYGAEEFDAIADFLKETTNVLVEEAKKPQHRGEQAAS
jgi:hypothetical protein